MISCLIPFDPVRGCAQQGQNRDNFIKLIFAFASVALIVGAVVQANSSRKNKSERALPTQRPTITVADPNLESNSPLAKKSRRGKRSKRDRGLPPQIELEKLADAYLRNQRRLWPEIESANVIPEPTKVEIAMMVEEFKRRHRGELPDPETVKPFRNVCEKLGGSYSRFSCDRSEPTSIIDQLVSQLERAKQEARFIPWAYVYADYSISGFGSARQGFGSYKNVLAQIDQFIDTTYIDDFTRASREELEWWKLATISTKHNKRLIGASDGFSLDNEQWEIQIKLFSLFSMLFKLQSKQKVRRGMRGAFREGGVVGKLIMGHTRAPRIDSNGNIVFRSNGKPKHVRCIDKQGNQKKRLLYHLFLRKNWSLGRIATAFNKKKVDGWDRWSPKSVAYELNNPANVGIFLWNQFRTEYDWENQVAYRVRNEPSKWEVYIDKSLALVSLSEWKQARRRLAELRKAHPRTGKPLTRNQRSASTLFSATLYCEYCLNNDDLDDRSAEIKLYRSAGDYKQMACMNGVVKKCGCSLTSSKSVKIIENSLMTFLFDELLTEKGFTDLVERCNEYLAEESRKPPKDVKPLQARLRKLNSEIKRLFGRIKKAKDENLFAAYEKEIASTQKEITKIESQLREMSHENAPSPVPLDRGQVEKYLADANALLRQDAPAAAEIIRKLTGRITIRQEKIEGKKRGARWIATFSPQLLTLLATMGRAKGYPETRTLEYLSSRNWIKPNPILKIQLATDAMYDLIVPRVLELKAQGQSEATIAVAMNINVETVQNAMKVSQGKKPRTKSKRTKKKETIDTPRGNARNISSEVASRRDDLGHAFTKIASDLKCNVKTVYRAYNIARPELVEAAIENAEPVRRANNSRLSQERKDKLEQLIIAGIRTDDIVRQIACSRSTIYRIRCRIFGSEE